MVQMLFTVTTKPSKINLLNIIQGDQKVCAPDDYSIKKTQKYFKLFKSLAMIT
jgi:hypothetical protein